MRVIVKNGSINALTNRSAGNEEACLKFLASGMGWCAKENETVVKREV